MENIPGIPQADGLQVKKSTLTGSKTLDVILGIFWNIGVSGGILLIWVDYDYVLGVLCLFMIVSMIFTRVMGRKYIFYGILSTLIVPLIVFGACMMIFSVGGGI